MKVLMKICKKEKNEIKVSDKRNINATEKEIRQQKTVKNTSFQEITATEF